MNEMLEKVSNDIYEKYPELDVSIYGDEVIEIIYSENDNMYFNVMYHSNSNENEIELYVNVFGIEMDEQHNFEKEKPSQSFFEAIEKVKHTFRSYKRKVYVLKNVIAEAMEDLESIGVTYPDEVIEYILTEIRKE